MPGGSGGAGGGSAFGLPVDVLLGGVGHAFLRGEWGVIANGVAMRRERRGVICVMSDDSPFTCTCACPDDAVADDAVAGDALAVSCDDSLVVSHDGVARDALVP